MDRKVLRQLQRDCDISLDMLSLEIGLSRNACWRRIKHMQDAGLIRKRVALLDAPKLGLGLTVYIQVRAEKHAAGWSAAFARATRSIPEITGVFRMSGDLDYLIRAHVADMAGYDRLYQKMIAEVSMADVSASFVMESIKDTTELPI
ncbi:MAG: Lrp/AsnC family transcriptional regulator [Lentibacter algarum]|jgi:Lrp/AsnC family transcriptional regulator|uniref:Transcriptional regulator, AsnC family n=2 Tax=Roseobacteraceae TaxID=2854170 RepID=A0A1H3KYL1_9RHOB|nr:Lrp/AsnC family transcriptional regulator [Lentibacter algarum]MCO4826929.1 Lrp/AsnC family transcriptional regulator [Lentibacter algarum]WIF31679.1 transcriptional regulator, AsnC family [Lentibacter algarum]SDY56808.1 transcriptional regulator, AsnC family [Lentibacter algarum]